MTKTLNPLYLDQYEAITSFVSVNPNCTISDIYSAGVIDRGRVTVSKRVAELLEDGVISGHGNRPLQYRFETWAPILALSKAADEELSTRDVREMEGEEEVSSVGENRTKVILSLFDGNWQTSMVAGSTGLSANAVRALLKQLQADGIAESETAEERAMGTNRSSTNEYPGGATDWRLTKEGKVLAKSLLAAQAESTIAADSQPWVSINLIAKRIGYRSPSDLEFVLKADDRFVARRAQSKKDGTVHTIFALKSVHDGLSEAHQTVGEPVAETVSEPVGEPVKTELPYPHWTKKMLGPLTPVEVRVAKEGLAKLKKQGTGGWGTLLHHKIDHYDIYAINRVNGGAGGRIPDQHRWVEKLLDEGLVEQVGTSYRVPVVKITAKGEAFLAGEEAPEPVTEPITETVEHRIECEFETASEAAEEPVDDRFDDEADMRREDETVYDHRARVIAQDVSGEISAALHDMIFSQTRWAMQDILLDQRRELENDFDDAEIVSLKNQLAERDQKIAELQAKLDAIKAAF